MRFPVRATVKQIQADWAGGPVWEMPIPGEGGLRVVGGPQVAGGAVVPLIEGTLTHNLPGTLTDVVIVVVRGQRPLAPARTTPGFDMSLLASALAYQVSEWPAGEPLDLGITTLPRTQQASQELAETYLRRMLPTVQSWQSVGSGEPTVNDGRTNERLAALALFTQLEPPSPDASNSVTQYAAQRSATHTWDLGRWFTQPSIIVIGVLSEGPSPIPLRLDGNAFESTGTTVVRWVYPLPTSTPIHPPTPFVAPPPKPESGEGTQNEPLPPGAPGG
jgi:hypothetical protein